MSEELFKQFPFLKKNFVMVDIETLSTKSNAVMVSLGACEFDFVTGIGEKFVVNIEPESCKALGGHIDKETIEWWMKQSKEARNSWRVNAVPVEDAMSAFLDWWPSKDHVFTCNGMSFDAPIISYYIKSLGMKVPWKYNNEFDLRTVYKLFNVSTSSFKTDEEKDTVFHDALADAEFQTRNLLKLFT